MSSQKGFAPLLILIAVLIVAGIAIGAYNLGTKNTQKQPVATPTSQVTPTSSPSPSSEATDSASIQLSLQKKYGFSMSFPSDWELIKLTKPFWSYDNPQKDWEFFALRPPKNDSLSIDIFSNTANLSPSSFISDILFHLTPEQSAIPLNQLNLKKSIDSTKTVTINNIPATYIGAVAGGAGDRGPGYLFQHNGFSIFIWQSKCCTSEYPRLDSEQIDKLVNTVTFSK